MTDRENYGRAQSGPVVATGQEERPAERAQPRRTAQPRGDGDKRLSMRPLLERFGVGGHEHEFVLKTVQPALAGLMDGSVSTLAPIFASAFATRDPHITFVVGLAAAVGAGISMAFSEALSDTGELTGRGEPIGRGAITGLTTALGGIGHTLPFLIPHIQLALYLAFIVVGLELVIIAFIRYRYFHMSFWLSMLQVVFGGALVFVAGILIGSA